MEKHEHKINLIVRIEEGNIFKKEYVVKQKLQVIVNNALENLNINLEGRALRRESGDELKDYGKTIEEIGLKDGEILTFVVKAPTPPRKEGFAYGN